MKEGSLYQRSLICLVTACVLAGMAFAGDWHDEFTDICGRVETADTLSTEELRSLISRSDKLLDQIQASDDPSKNIYISRLKKCRDFFTFTLDLKQEVR